MRVQATVLNSLNRSMVARGFFQLLPVITFRLTDSPVPDPKAGWSLTQKGVLRPIVDADARYDCTT